MKKSKKIILAMISFAVLGLIFTQCSKDQDKNLQQNQQAQQNYTVVDDEPNPTPEELGKLPAATVKIKSFSSTAYLKSTESTSNLLPALLEATLAAEEFVPEKKTGFIDGAPPKGDVLFCFDLTGSMGDELNNAKVNSASIMGSVRSIISDTYFGVMSHMDYTEYYSSCGYNATYGYTTYGDYPYSLDQPLSNDNSVVTASINSLTLGYGSDGAESYTRAFYESYSDASIGWRSGTKKIVIAILDYIPHDCNVYSILGGTRSTGVDPGRDATVETSDDLAILDVLNDMNNNNITLIVLYSGSEDFDLWQAFAGLTGGTAFQINSDGTIPGGVNIEDQIAVLIQDEVSTVDEITLEVCTPGFESWLTSITPTSYTGVSLESPWTEEFDIEITVPAGTEDGEYAFNICLIGDGVEYGSQTVEITVQNAIEVPFDIHPTSCPNPINRKSGGKMPAAILGFAGFDVTDINVATVNIQGVYAVNSSIEDVATPYYPFIDKTLDKMSCNTFSADGYSDLTLKFQTQEIAALLAGYEKGDIVKLEVSGELNDGTMIVGEDIIIIVK